MHLLTVRGKDNKMKLNWYIQATIFIASFAIYLMLFPDPLFLYFNKKIYQWILWISSQPCWVIYFAFVSPLHIAPTLLLSCITWGIACGIICFYLNIKYSGYYSLVILCLYWLLYLQDITKIQELRYWDSIIRESIILCICIFSAYISEIVCNFTIRVISRVSKLVKRRDDVNK